VLSLTRPWIWTFSAALAATVLAAAGLLANLLVPAGSPALAAPLLMASLACTAVAFARMALRVRRLELENEGLVEEISQEFDRVKGKLDIFSDALAAPGASAPAEATDRTGQRRVVVK
jgi:hypothetical protein